jgi:hypothetical protein
VLLQSPELAPGAKWDFFHPCHRKPLHLPPSLLL